MYRFSTEFDFYRFVYSINVVYSGNIKRLPNGKFGSLGRKLPLTKAESLYTLIVYDTPSEGKTRIFVRVMPSFFSGF